MLFQQKKSKVEQEIDIIYFMIKLYCKNNHKTNKLCNECSELYAYAIKRIEFCPRKEEKTFCSTCHIHCYSKDKRLLIKSIMRYSGPRMILYHPILAIKHLLDSKRERK